MLPVKKLVMFARAVPLKIIATAKRKRTPPNYAENKYEKRGEGTKKAHE